MNLFEVKNLCFSYASEAEKRALDDINLNIEEGSCVVICGVSGSGKTTLLKQFKPSLTPAGKSSGMILYNGEDIKSLSPFDDAVSIGFVMQHTDEQIVTDTVWHELSFGLENIGTDSETIRKRMAETAGFFGLNYLLDKKTEELSGGEKQIINLAAQVVMGNKVLLLDEPTSQLDPVACDNFLKMVEKINTELGITVIINEHRLNKVLDFATYLIVMDNGKIVHHGRPGDVIRALCAENNELFCAAPVSSRIFYMLGSTGTCPFNIRDGRSFIKKFKDIVTPAETDRIIKNKQVIQINPDESTAVSLNNVSFRYDKFSGDILECINISFEKGRITAIVGGNGSGKSTLLKIICGLLKPYRGKVNLNSDKVVMLPQDPKSIFVKDSVKAELEEMSDDGNIINDVAAFCGIENILDKHPFDISGGEQQKTALAKVLLAKPEILLLDEPAKFTDISFKNEFARLMKKMRDNGITIIIVSHDLEFCAENADDTMMVFDRQIIGPCESLAFFRENDIYTTESVRLSKGILDNVQVTFEGLYQYIMQIKM